MTNEEILKKAIEKAEKNDYKCPDVQGYYFEIIYSHEFAKAFWGEEIKHEHFKFTDGKEHNCGCDTWWEYHLQKMVISEDPIKYLEAFL